MRNNKKKENINPKIKYKQCRIFNFYINSIEKNNGSSNNNAYFFIDWSATIPRAKYKCSFVYNSVTTNNVIRPDNGAISPSLVHINL